MSGDKHVCHTRYGIVILYGTSRFDRSRFTGVERGGDMVWHEAGESTADTDKVIYAMHYNFIQYSRSNYIFLLSIIIFIFL